MKVLSVLTNYDGRSASIMPLSFSEMSPSIRCYPDRDRGKWTESLQTRPCLYDFSQDDGYMLLLCLSRPCLSWLMLARRRTMCWVDPLLPFSCLSSQVLLMSQGPHKLADHHPVMHIGAGTCFYGTLQCCSGGNKHILRCYNSMPLHGKCFGGWMVEIEEIKS